MICSETDYSGSVGWCNSPRARASRDKDYTKEARIRRGPKEREAQAKAGQARYRAHWYASTACTGRHAHTKTRRAYLRTHKQGLCTVRAKLMLVWFHYILGRTRKHSQWTTCKSKAARWHVLISMACGIAAGGVLILGPASCHTVCPCVSSQCQPSIKRMPPSRCWQISILVDYI
jgi:hypothetical protein